MGSPTDLNQPPNTRREKLSYVSRRISLPGFQKQSLYDVFTFFRQELMSNSLQVRASAVAFNFLLATFPTLLVLFTLIAYLPIPHLKFNVLMSIKGVMPDNGYQFIRSTLEDILNQHHGGLLSVGLLISVYYSSRGVAGLMNSFDKVNPAYRKRTFINKLLVSFKITGLLIFLVLLSMGLMVADQWLVHFFSKGHGRLSAGAIQSIHIAKWTVILLFFFVAISLIFYYGPATHTRWRFITPGSILAAILSISASLLFSYLMNNFGQLNKLYGSIGTVIMLMFWIYWNSLVLLIGYELNASIEINKHYKMLAKQGKEGPKV